MKTNKIQKVSIFILSLLLLISAVVFGINSPQVVFAEETTNETVWGGIDIRDCYFYDENNLNLRELMKINFDKSKLSKASPIKIAIIDTGLYIDKKNESLFDGLISIDLATKDWEAYNAFSKQKGKEAVQDETSPDLIPVALHGTSVASIVAMQIKALGLQDYIKIYPIKANEKGSKYFKLEDVKHAIEYASKNIKADVINMSLGTIKQNEWHDNKQLINTINQAAETSIIVAAAGNDDEVYDPEIVGGRPFSPAYYDHVISVMASNGEGKKHVTSNYGMYDVIAPGNQIWAYVMDENSNKGKIGYGYISGTSMAAPLVSAFAAIYKTRLKTLLDEKNMPRPNVIAETIINTNLNPINFDAKVQVMAGDNKADITKTYQLKRIDYKGLLSREDYSDGFIYQEPENIKIEEISREKFEFVTNAYMGLFQEGMEIKFRAKLLPLDLVHPSKEANITWYRQKPNGVTENLATGADFTFNPTEGGSYLIVASYDDGSIQISDQVSINVAYMPYQPNLCRITTIDKINNSHEDVPKTIDFKQYKKVTLGITGLTYVDTSQLRFKWYLNGKEVGEGLTYDYKPNKSGKDVIYVAIHDTKAGDGSGYEYIPVPLTSNVISFMEEPLAIFSLVVLVLVIGSGIGISLYVYCKHKLNKKMM